MDPQDAAHLQVGGTAMGTFAQAMLSATVFKIS